MSPDVFDVIRSGPSLVNAENGQWLTPAEIRTKTLVFIHGFTSHGGYMTTLASYCARHGYGTALFTYDSSNKLQPKIDRVRSRLIRIRPGFAKPQSPIHSQCAGHGRERVTQDAIVPLGTRLLDQPQQQRLTNTLTPKYRPHKQTLGLAPMSVNWAQCDGPGRDVPDPCKQQASSRGRVRSRQPPHLFGKPLKLRGQAQSRASILSTTRAQDRVPPPVPRAPCLMLQLPLL